MYLNLNIDQPPMRVLPIRENLSFVSLPGQKTQDRGRHLRQVASWIDATSRSPHDRRKQLQPPLLKRVEAIADASREFGRIDVVI